MIFYFSGTGNSQLAAKEIGAVTGEPVVSINQLLKEGAKGSFQSDGPAGVCHPDLCLAHAKGGGAMDSRGPL